MNTRYSENNVIITLQEQCRNDTSIQVFRWNCRICNGASETRFKRAQCQHRLAMRCGSKVWASRLCIKEQRVNLLKHPLLQ